MRVYRARAPVPVAVQLDCLDCKLDRYFVSAVRIPDRILVYQLIRYSVRTRIDFR